MTNNSLPLEIIQSKIYVIRNKKVMLDRDLAYLYVVETKVLNQAVRRNISRFPEDFMFQLTWDETKQLQNPRSQFVTLDSGKNIKYLPFAFTEYGIAMLSSVLKSEQAITMNIQIMRTFGKLREMMMNYQELKDKVEAMERKYDTQFKSIFDAIKLLISNDQEIHKRVSQEEEKKRDTQFGFKPNKK